MLQEVKLDFVFFFATKFAFNLIVLFWNQSMKICTNAMFTRTG